MYDFEIHLYTMWITEGVLFKNLKYSLMLKRENFFFSTFGQDVSCLMKLLKGSTKLIKIGSQWVNGTIGGSLCIVL